MDSDEDGELSLVLSHQSIATYMFSIAAASTRNSNLRKAIDPESAHGFWANCLVNGH